jgi:hypothetical protein
MERVADGGKVSGKIDLSLAIVIVISKAPTQR